MGEGNASGQGKRRVAAVVAGLLVLVLPACSRGGIEEPSPAEVALGQRLNDFHEQVKRDGFQGIVEIRRDGERLLSEAYGMADTAASRRNAVDTPFRVGALTEQVTALAVLALQADRRLQVADPVCRYLPGCPPAWQAITVKDLLLHTSGLPDYLALGAEEQAALDARRLPHLAFVGHMQGKPVERPPGTWKRNGTDYVVLGALIEHLTSKPYGEHVTATILRGLGMNDTGTDWERTNPVTRATGHVGDRAADPVPLTRYADRALVTTAADLARWNAFLLTGLPPGAPVEARLRLVDEHTGPATGEGDTRQGHGALFRGSAGWAEVHAMGAVAGFEAFSGVRMKAGVSVVVLTNATSAADATSPTAPTSPKSAAGSYGTKAAEMGVRLLAIASPS